MKKNRKTIDTGLICKCCGAFRRADISEMGISIEVFNEFQKKYPEAFKLINDFLVERYSK